jgi:hexosaminidase
MYKMNTFHWHLTEDQGWRIEIKKYPRLTEVGSYRKETILARNFDPYIGDKKPYGGFYTQDEVRQVVAYAKSRYVTVIPEIEMPGHSVAALAAYPELACTPGPFETATIWGVNENIYCPSEQTFAFLEDVLTEVMELFPGRYIHIGGDEAPKTRWEESELAQEVMRREGLADEDELQSYFIRRIERFLLEHDRRLIGWDEILEGGLAPQATVMSWRGTVGGIDAAKQGHDVIMTPTSHVYLDYYQGDPLYEPLAIGGYTPLETVYAFEPVPDELSPEEAKHVLGAQGNVWTEYMKTTQYVEYMVFPRMLALAEVVWSPQASRDWDRFSAALPAQLRLLDQKRVNYRVPHVRGLERDRITLDDRIAIPLTSLIPEAEIRYTVDGSDPTGRSMLYTAPLDLTVDEVGVTVTARAYLPSGKASANRTATFTRASLREAADVDADELRPGLRYAYFEATVSSVNELSELESARHGVTERVALQGTERPERFGLIFEGYVQVPADGVYTFALTSDDGSVLYIDDELVVDNDGGHGPIEKLGMIALEAGHHPLEIRYSQGSGGKELRFGVKVDGKRGPEEATVQLLHKR